MPSSEDPGQPKINSAFLKKKERVEYLKELGKIHQKERKYRHHEQLMGVSKHDGLSHESMSRSASWHSGVSLSKLEGNYRGALHNDQKNGIALLHWPEDLCFWTWKQFSSFRAGTMEGAEEKKKKVPAVTKTLKKKRKNFSELKIKRLRKKFERKMLQKARRKLIYEKAKHYHKKYRQMYRTEIRMARMAWKASNFCVPTQPKLTFVLRIRGSNGVSPKVCKVLQLLSLRQIFNGTFVKLNKASINMLRVVEPYIAWGYPKLKSVNELICKRGYGKINKKWIALTDNALWARSLGNTDSSAWKIWFMRSILLENVSKKQTTSCGPLNCLLHEVEWRKKATHFVEGGDAGNREDQINRLLEWWTKVSTRIIFVIWSINKQLKQTEKK